MNHNLFQDDSGQSEAVSYLDPGARDSLLDVVAKSLTKLAAQESDTKQPDIDDTILT